MKGIIDLIFLVFSEILTNIYNKFLNTNYKIKNLLFSSKNRVKIEYF